MSATMILLTLGLLALLFSAYTPAAYAYLDPGTGSYIFQILIAGLVGGLFAVKIFWARIKAFLSKLFGKDKDGTKAQGKAG